MIYAGVPEVTKVVDTALGRNGAPDTGWPLADQDQRPRVRPGGRPDPVRERRDGVRRQHPVVLHGQRRQDDRRRHVPATAGQGRCAGLQRQRLLAEPARRLFLLLPAWQPGSRLGQAASGPAAGGTVVTITGQNLGCVTGVSFGPVPARKFRNGKAFGFCGSTSEVIATAPPGAQGTVKVTVTTVESDLTGAGPSRSTAKYTYDP